MRTTIGIASALSCMVLVACASSSPGPAPTPDGGTCSAGNCLGCCKGSTCVDPPTVAACGSFGSVCTVCSSTQVCGTTGACEAAPAGCTGCSGCCKNGLCYPGNTDTSCGASGGACVDCTSSGKTCNSSTNTCQTSAGCTGCTGCCKNNVCNAGTTAASCGKGGGACVDCASSGKTCSASGVCQSAPSCSGCSGCCDGSQCLSGTSDSACGTAGAACVDCSASSKICGSSGSCEAQAGCGPSNCTGCCASGACVSGTSKTECGTGGKSCTSCSQGFQQCTSGGCVVDPSSKWQVIAVSAVISQAKIWDPWLAAAYEPPDPYFGMDTNGCSSMGLDGCGPSVNNTFTPSWNGAVKNVGFTVSFTASELKGSWCAFVGDADGTGACIVPFETMGICTVSVTDQELTQGSKTISSCPNPNDGVNYVSSLKLQFKYAP